MRVGERAPDFELPDQAGEARRLSSLLESGPLALFFYPAALTPGCTKEACHFRDLGADFAAAGVQRVGISRDAVDKQRRFADRYSFDYPLLSDADGAVARAYGVQRGGLGLRLGLPVQRTTFAVRADGTVAALIRSEFSMDRHADEALRALTR